MVRYQEVPAQNVVLYYVLMEFGNRTCAYLYQVADVLWVVLVRVVPVQVQNFSTAGHYFCPEPASSNVLTYKIVCIPDNTYTRILPDRRETVPVRKYPGTLVPRTCV